uniref:Focal_AT domain-containing protein n=1 Tax=Angiostrongylus cantonensis TaxID=6313 RepID=A0A0K0DM61_ANGCA
MNTLADYGDESDEESPRRRSFNVEQSNGLGEVPSSTHSQENTSVHSPKARRDSDYSPRPRRDSDAMFDDTDTMFDEPRRYSSFSDNSEHSENTEFREPPPPKRKEYHSPSPSLPTPTSKIPQEINVKFHIHTFLRVLNVGTYVAQLSEALCNVIDHRGPGPQSSP